VIFYSHIMYQKDGILCVFIISCHISWCREIVVDVGAVCGVEKCLSRGIFFTGDVKFRAWKASKCFVCCDMNRQELLNLL